MVIGIYPPIEHPCLVPTTNMEERMGGDKGMGILDLFEEREGLEIEYCKLYAEGYRHGTGGHHMRLLIAKLYDLLEEYYPEEEA